jgi:hypothetical protein
MGGVTIRLEIELRGGVIERREKRRRRPTPPSWPYYRLALTWALRLFAATRCAAARAACAQAISSSCASNNRSGTRQNERSMVEPFFTWLREGNDSASLKVVRFWLSTRK